MGHTNISKDFILNVNVNYKGNTDTLEFKMEFSMYDGDDCAVPEYDNKLTLDSKISLVIDESDLDDLKNDIDMVITNNHTHKMKDGDTIELNAHFFEETGVWDIDIAEIGSIG